MVAIKFPTKFDFDRSVAVCKACRAELVCYTHFMRTQKWLHDCDSNRFFLDPTGADSTK